MTKKQEILKRLSIIISNSAFTNQDAQELLDRAEKTYLRSIQTLDKAKLDDLQETYKKLKDAHEKLKSK